MKNAYIVSLKFSPGMANAFCILGENLEANGFAVTYILCKKYQRLMKTDKTCFYLVEDSNMKNMLSDSLLKLPNILLGKLSTKFKTKTPDTIIFYNQHPLNVAVAAKVFVANKKSKRAVILHEPYLENREHFSRKFLLKVTIMENLQRAMLAFCNHAILPSENAFRQFKMLAPNYNGSTHIAPLMEISLEDEHPQSESREYISFIGRMDNPNKGLDQFLRLIEYCHEKKPHIKFKLLTATPISEYVNDNLSKNAMLSLTLDVRKRVSNADIYQAMQQSYSVLLLHRHISQSGVLPFSFMNGTPVICRNLAGFRQHVTQYKTGVLVDVDAENSKWLEAIEWSIKNFEKVNKLCRNRFENEFSSKNWIKYYDWILN